MEASTLRTNRVGSTSLATEARVNFLRLQSDERLVNLVRRGNDYAYEALVGRYSSRLLAFCRHMVGSKEDAEDILQDVFAAAYQAMRADEREILVRPWFYRIARNRCLNHLRRPRPTGMDSMDIYEGGGGATTADRVEAKLQIEDLVVDVGKLPESQRTALLLREMGSLSYDQIALAMDNTVPSVKSLLVRARVSLAESAEARKLTCDEVRLELGAEAEGIKKLAPPVRKHLADCDRCNQFRRELKQTNRKIAMLAPVGPLLFLKFLVATKLFGGGAAGSAAGGTAAGAGGTTAIAGSTAIGSVAAGAGAGTAVGGAAASGGLVSAGLSAVATKAAAGLVAATLVTAGATEVAINRNDRPVTESKGAVSTLAAPAAPLIQNVTPVTTPAADEQAAAEAGPTGQTGATGNAGAGERDDQPEAIVKDPPAAEPTESEGVIVDETESTVIVQPPVVSPPPATPVTGPGGPAGPSGPTGQGGATGPTSSSVSSSQAPTDLSVGPAGSTGATGAAGE